MYFIELNDIDPNRIYFIDYIVLNRKKKSKSLSKPCCTEKKTHELFHFYIGARVF